MENTEQNDVLRHNHSLVENYLQDLEEAYSLTGSVRKCTCEGREGFSVGGYTSCVSVPLLRAHYGDNWRAQFAAESERAWRRGLARYNKSC